MSIIAGVGASRAVGPTSGGKVSGLNVISTVPAFVAVANPSRVKITFHNPGVVDIYVAPQFIISPQTGKNVALAPSLLSLGGCFIVYANGGERTFEGECQGAWQAFAASGATNPLTIMDSNT